MEEIEIKFLDINVEKLEKKLNDIGAQKIGEFFYKRTHFDYPDLRLDNSGAWLRVRDEGEKITIAYKNVADFTSHDKVNKDSAILEKEITVSNFDTACDIFLSMGLIKKSYQENKRIRYVLNQVEIDIDFWPLIPPYVEIEANTKDELENVVYKLGFDMTDAVKYSAGLIYERHYGIKLHDYLLFTFDKQIKK